MCSPNFITNTHTRLHPDKHCFSLLSHSRFSAESILQLWNSIKKPAEITDGSWLITLCLAVVQSYNGIEKKGTYSCSFHYNRGYVIRILALGNQHIFIMFTASQDNVIAIGDFLHWLPISQVNGWSQKRSTTPCLLNNSGDLLDNLGKNDCKIRHNSLMNALLSNGNSGCSFGHKLRTCILNDQGNASPQNDLFAFQLTLPRAKSRSTLGVENRALDTLKEPGEETCQLAGDE